MHSRLSLSLPSLSLLSAPLFRGRGLLANTASKQGAPFGSSVTFLATSSQKVAGCSRLQPEERPYSWAEERAHCGQAGA